MRQPRINTIADLFSAGTKFSAGSNEHGVALGLTVGTKVLVDADLNQFGLAFDAHRAAKVEFRGRRTALKGAQNAAFEFDFATRDSLKRALGRKYSSAWEGSGFNNSLVVPRSVARLQLLTRSLQSYLADHPELEVEDAVTAVLAQGALDNLTNAQTAVDLQKSAVGTLLTARKQKEKQLRLRLRWVIDELSRVLGPLDNRWTAFGLNRPGVQETPPRPGKINVTVSGLVGSVKWAKSPRADYYRLWLKRLGLDEEAQNIGNASDPNFTIESLPAASQFELSISASNNGGESARSEVVTITTV